MLEIVFSRDRAMQLDATLRSFLLHCRDPEEIKLLVIFKATSPLHAKEYDTLTQEYNLENQIRFIEQKKFRLDLLDQITPIATTSVKRTLFHYLSVLGPRFGYLSRLLNDSKNPNNIFFIVDDNIFVRDFHLTDIREALDYNPRALGFSLRLGRNTTYCYTKDQAQALPTFKELSNDILLFDWTSAEGDFGYPLEVSSSIYRIRDLLPFIEELQFDNPNTLEGQMAARVSVFKKDKPLLLCYKESVTFCAPLNVVQTTYKNRSGTQQLYTSTNLAEMFAAGYRIKIEDLAGFVPYACHQEIELPFEKRYKD